ncbi:MAG: hypothetical protein KDD58_03110 [Bdellovibrionales bacterium]|nr:hypothetical protein [Bdellovibrionales bacterium]
MLRFIIIFIFSLQAKAKLNANYLWQCKTNSQLIGSSEKAYDSIAKDTLVGKGSFFCNDKDETVTQLSATNSECNSNIPALNELTSNLFNNSNITENLKQVSAEKYIIRLEGLMNTGFNSSDEVNINLTRYTNYFPQNFSQIVPKLKICSDYPIGNEVYFIVSGLSLDGLNEVHLKVKSPTYIANNVKAFLVNASLIIEKDYEQLATNSH